MRDFLINMGKQKPLFRWGGVSLLLLILSIIYYVAALMPHNEKMEKMRKTYDSKVAELRKMAITVNTMGRYLEDIELLNRRFNVASRMLPEKKEIPSLLKKLSEEAEKYGLDVTFFEPRPDVVKEFYAEIPVQIKLIGSYHEILSFFDSVNKLARIVNISNIEMKTTKTKKKVNKNVKGGTFTAFQPNKTNLNVSFKATTYRFLGEDEMHKTKKKKGGKRGRKK